MKRPASTWWHGSPNRGRWLLLGTFKADARVRTEPFEAIEFDLATLWAR